MQNDMPLISVIIATYRRSDELRNAICSIVNQTYHHFEIILVDDNADIHWNNKVSTIVAQIREKTNLDIRLIVNKQNRGSATSRNQGIKFAKGDYITFLDDDDLYLPEKLAMQVRDMIATGADFGITDLYLYNDQNILIDKRIRSYIQDVDTHALIRYHLMHHMTGTDTLMFRTEYLRKIGGFPGIDIGDEFYLMKEAILGGGKIAYSNHCYVRAYIHTGEMNGLSSGQRKIDGENTLFEEKKKYFDLLSKPEIRKIKMRHYAVLAFAELRRKRMLHFLGYATQSFLCTPMGLLNMVLSSR